MIRSSTPITALPPLPPPLPLAPPPTHSSSSSLNIDIALTYHPDARPSTFGGSNALGVLLSGITIQPHASAADGQVFVVEHEAGDPLDPQTWSVRSRIAATLLIGSIAFVVGVASSIDSAVVKEAAREFGVNEEVETLATGRYLVGLGIGALFSGPCSETLGRNPVYVGTLTLYMASIAASGLSPTVGAQIAFRFLAGFFGSTPLTCAGGSIADLWSPVDRVYAFPVFANAAFLGPVLGPILGAFIAQSEHVSWRWVEWTSLILAAAVLVAVLLFQPETYSPVLLRWKSHHLRALLGDDRYVAAVELAGDTFWTRLRLALYRPFALTATEPIISLTALYLTVIYVVLFTFFDGYDYIYGRVHGTSQVATAFCFVAIAVGLFGATALAPLVYRWARRGQLEKGDGPPPPLLPLKPEFRLWYSMLGGSVCIPVSLLWMGWSSSARVSIWSPLVASVLFGYGILCVFISSYLYIIDSYESVSASALASVTLVRYVAAGGMVSAGMPMYEKLGVHWTLTIMGGLAALMAPVPYVFYYYGERIRGKSKYINGK
ncbi:major facilitator superfamily domain-containing protein [Phyllosticta capitalensis]